MDAGGGWDSLPNTGDSRPGLGLFVFTDNPNESYIRTGALCSELSTASVILGLVRIVVLFTPDTEYYRRHDRALVIPCSAIYQSGIDMGVIDCVMMRRTRAPI